MVDDTEELSRARVMNVAFGLDPGDTLTLRFYLSFEDGHVRPYRMDLFEAEAFIKEGGFGDIRDMAGRYAFISWENDSPVVKGWL